MSSQRSRRTAWFERLMTRAEPLARYVPPTVLVRTVRGRMDQHEHRHPEIASFEALVTVTRDVRLTVEGQPDTAYDVYAPRAGDGRAPVLLWWHGGGFIGGDKGTICCLAYALAADGNVVVVGNYALSPEAPYPVAVQQAVAMVDEVVDRAPEWGGDPSRVVLGGESAGCGIAAEIIGLITSPVLAQRFGATPRLSREHLRAAVLYCGPHDMATVAETGFPFIESLMWAYTGRRHWRDLPRLAELSSVRWVNPDWPPSLITAGDGDPLRPQSIALIEALRATGVEPDTLLADGGDEPLPHAYELAYDTPAGLAALERTRTFLRSHARVVNEASRSR